MLFTVFPEPIDIKFLENHPVHKNRKENFVIAGWIMQILVYSETVIGSGGFDSLGVFVIRLLNLI